MLGSASSLAPGLAPGPVAPSPSPRPARARLEGLTGLRFLAAAWVFAYHFLVLTVDGRLAPPWATLVRRLQETGHAAVSLFFVLSGFVLAYNYAAPLAAGSVGRARFWWLRLARVWPLYILATLIEIPLSLHAGVAPARVGAATAGDLLGLQAWLPAITFVGNTPGWSVSVELFFYVAFPWLVSWFATPRRTRVLLALFVLLTLAAAATPALVPARSAAATFLKCGPPLRLPEFVVGVGLGCAFVRRRRALAPATATLLAMAALLAVGALLLAAPAVPRYFLHALLVAPFALLLWAVAEGGARWLGSRPLTLLGEASYGLYLLQMPLFQAIGGKYEWGWAAMAGWFALLVAVSIAVHFAVEKPAQRWLVRYKWPRSS